MIRERVSRFLAYSAITHTVRRSILTSFAGFYISNIGSASMSSIKKYDSLYDLAVIGGGSGGLAAAFQANKHGLSVVVIDFVEQSLHKSKWGLGGTCVNVGCIPKKLMHQAAKYSQQLINSSQYGWQLPDSVNDRSKQQEIKKHFNWTKLRNKIQGYIKSINFGYVATINKGMNMDYLNCLATFKDKDTIICSKNPKVIYEFITTGQLPSNQDNKHFFQIKAKNFIIATGTRPSYMSIQGAQHAITSDDIFMKKDAPGKTLIVGGGYVGVQIAGFLNGMGYNTNLMTRGDYLRSFDRDMVNFIMTDLRQRKVNIIQTSLPVKIQKLPTGKLNVSIKHQQTNNIHGQQFDTVIFAVGRTATTDKLNLDKVGVQTHTNKKIVTRAEELERTNIGHIYAVGDVVNGLPQLTSTATKMGWSLGRRIVQRLGKGKFKEHQLSVSLQNYPTTIFTPLQYSCAGLNEQQAKKKHGSDIKVYHIQYTPLEENMLQKYNQDGSNYKTDVYAKAIVQTSTDRVLGFHYAGPNAGQVMQGFAVALKIGLTKAQLDNTIGIHPTAAEQLTNMNITKQSGQEYMKTSC